MGLVTYANRIKTELLAVPEEMLARVGAVSPEVGKCMAENVRKAGGKAILASASPALRALAAEAGKSLLAWFIFAWPQK